jgi:macrolide-specific efflux system membrane fusion protein
MLKLRRPRLGALNLTLLAVLLALGSGGGWLVWGQPDAAETAATTTAQVSKTDVISTVSADGTVEPNDSADVSFDTDGIISRIPVEVGDTVKVGDVLAYVSNSTARAELKSAQAGLKAAKANQEAVEEETDDDDDATQISDEERDKQRASAKASVEQAKVAVLQAEESISDLTLRAPVAGTVTAINGTVGSSTNGNGSGADSDSANGGGSTFATIADMSSWVVDCSFAEADVAKVKKGDEVQITFGSVPNETFTGRVRKIDLSATTSENVTTYGVEVDVLNAPSELRDGASASVTVTTASATNVLAVPTSAVTTDAQGQSTVKLVKHGKSTSRTVQVGIKGDTYTEITSGLKAGDVVELGATSTSSSGSNRGQMVEIGGGPGGGPMIKGAGG